MYEVHGLIVKNSRNISKKSNLNEIHGQEQN